MAHLADQINHIDSVSLIRYSQKLSLSGYDVPFPRPVRDFAFPDTNFVKVLLEMLSALRLVAGSKHAPRAFDSATWQAGASSDRGIYKTNQYARTVN